MKMYRIKKISKNYDNALCDMSDFGDSQEHFDGYPMNHPKVGERFILVDRTGGIVINTSPIVKIEDGKLTTTYSIYSIEKL